MNRAALQSLSRDDLIALSLAQSSVIDQQTARIDAQLLQIEMLSKRLAELEAKLGAPPKTPDNSSVPPSAAIKPNRAERRAAKKKGRPGVCRALAETPDVVVEARAQACPHCDHALGVEDQPQFHAYDHIDLPPIRPVVTRIHRHRGTCPCCARGFQAPAPEGLAPGSPFGPGIVALVLHLHITQAIGFERLAKLMDEVFGVTLSEGAIANMLGRAEAPMIVAAETIAEEVRSAKVVASDETSARVKGKTWWQWVMHCSTAIYHVITDSRAAKVVEGFLQGHRPEVWIADRYGAQAGHGLERQLCLAHLLRDAQYAIDEGDKTFAPAFKALLLRAIAIGRRRDDLKDATLAQYRADLERRLTAILDPPPTTTAGRKLAKGVKKCRNDLFLFVVRRDTPYTNNGSERALRPSVIFRKVTGCFRSHWGARLYAAALSVIATGRLHGKSALEAIREVISPSPALA
ncbi:MAG: IS66 family transposase [Caulobacteraceae bacterium]|nr:IS66 family transposase [Caulobacteraceae bacterium]